MRVLIIGNLSGQATTASKIAHGRGAKVRQVPDIESALNGLRGGQGADQGGGSDTLKAVVALGIYKLGSSLYDAWNSGAEIREKKESAMKNASTRFLKKLNEVRVAAKTNADKLAERHSWQTSEVGFSSQDKDGDLLERLAKESDYKGVLQVYRDRSVAKPRDPFLKTRINTFLFFSTENVLSANRAS